MSGPGVAARRLAIDALVRIERDDAYSNLLLPSMLDRSDLSPRDRAFVTELVYGTTRMRRACDHLVDRFLHGGDLEAQVRAALRIGAYQLYALETPRHAAVGATVGAVRGRGRGVVNAVLRRVADELDNQGGPGAVVWPDEATRLSYPDWLVDRLVADLGADAALSALEVMNRAAIVHEREDGYTQDTASQAVVAAVGAGPGDLIVDLCAAPGGKATGLAATGARVVAVEPTPSRARLVVGNAVRTGERVPVVIADGRCAPVRPAIADKVLVDAPCSGLGSLRRRPDARWRIDEDAPDRLADLQVALVSAGIELLRVGGVLTYSVCTLTSVETVGVRDRIEADAGATVEIGPVTTMPPTTTSDGMSWWALERVGP